VNFRYCSKYQGLIQYDSRCVCVCVCARAPAETLAVMQPGCMTDNLKVKLPHSVSLCRKIKSAASVDPHGQKQGNNSFSPWNAKSTLNFLLCYRTMSCHSGNVSDLCLADIDWKLGRSTRYTELNLPEIR